MNYKELSDLTTPNLQGEFSLEDADDELRPIASFIRKHTPHNSDISPERIKFFYTDKPKKEAGRYVIGNLVIRPDYERIIKDDYDYVAFVYYKVWKNLDVENKIIQLDKILSGIDMGSLENPKLGKKQADTREYLKSINYFGAAKVLNSSSVVHEACEQIIEEEKEAKRNGGGGKFTRNTEED